MISTQYLCVHCHYYQPPRGNPFSAEPLIEADAAPYDNWNLRISAECYKPNAEIGNFDGISFNLGETLAGWLDEHDSPTYARIIEADRANFTRYQAGNAIAQSMHHTILPLSRRADKLTQVGWGKIAFEHRFGHTTSGLWLPEMAVDYETLEALVAHGIEWTILSEGQVKNKPPGAGPYWISFGANKRIMVFIRDELLSNDIAFNLGRFGGAGRWAREVLVPRKRDAGGLTLIASDGETFGHHWKGEEQFLHWLLTYEAHAAGYEVINLSRYVRQAKPEAEIELRENTAWSCQHGLARWSTGCSCTPGESYWKGALRRAMDNLRSAIDDICESEINKIAGVSSLTLRDAYIQVVLGMMPRANFLAQHGITVSSDNERRLLSLIEAQYYRQCMYASCSWFFADLDAHTTRYGIANSAHAIRLVEDATGTDLSDGFRRDLSIATGRDLKTGQPVNGGQIFDELYNTMAPRPE